MTRVTAKRADGRPAYIAAKPRLRQSQVSRPFPHAPAEQSGWIARILRKVAR